jgi:hypothetical protein
MGSSAIQYQLKSRWVRSRVITDADTNGTVVVIEIPAGTFIPAFGVAIEILTAFAGGTPSLDVGDGDTADGWIDTTEITEVTPGTYTGVAAGFAVAGKYYAAAGQIQVVVSASLTDGKAYVLAHLLNVADVFDD